MSDKALWDQFNQNPLEVFSRATTKRNEQGFSETPNFGQVLEEFSPTERPGSLDAFGRMMREAGLVTESDPFSGYHASPVSDFMATPGTRALMTEFYRRTWLKATKQTKQDRQNMLAQVRAILLSDDGAIGSWERPYAESTSVMWNDQLSAEIPLSEIVGQTFTVNNTAYRGFFIEYDAEQLRKFRVGESAEIPIATIRGSEREIQLHKYGRGLRISYEDLNSRVDRLAWIIRFMAVQSEMDKVDAAIDTILTGDGNANTAATVHDLTTLDPAATPGTLTLKGWRNFRLQFNRPYQLTTALMSPDVALDLELLDIGTANSLAQTVGALGLSPTPINAPTGGIRYGWTAAMAEGFILGFDRRNALHHLIMAGSQISETDRFITNQTQVMTMTEIEGFMIGDPAASNVLDLEVP